MATGTRAWQAEQRALAKAEREASMARTRASLDAGHTAMVVSLPYLVGGKDEPTLKDERRFRALGHEEVEHSFVRSAHEEGAA